MATRIGPTLTLVASCEGCPWLRLDVTVWRCAHPLIADTRKPAVGGSAREPATPSGCPELPAARLAMALEIVGEADDVLCSKCGKPVATADERSYRMHSMAGCPR